MNSHLQLLRLRLLSATLRGRTTMPGAWRLVPIALRDARAVGSRLGRRCVKTVYGFDFVCDVGDWIGQYVFVTGNYEDSTAALIRRLLRPGCTAVDVGANVGFFTLLMATTVGASGSVHAFEPMPHAQAILTENLALNHVDNVELHPQAASDSVRMLPFYLGPPEHTSVASLLPHQRSSQRVDVSCVLLDDVLARCGPIELIKIDVEGWEEQVLHGARSLLDRCAPNLIVEVNSPAVSAFLLARGYRMFKIGWNELEPISDPAAPLLQQQFNALFTKKTV